MREQFDRYIMKDQKTKFIRPYEKHDPALIASICFILMICIGLIAVFGTLVSLQIGKSSTKLMIRDTDCRICHHPIAKTYSEYAKIWPSPKEKRK